MCIVSCVLTSFGLDPSSLATATSHHIHKNENKSPLTYTYPHTKCQCSALCLEFTLQPSTYATMLLRELLKRSMTADEMKKMNPPTQSTKPEEGGEGEGDKKEE